ncbi:unnamed protein product, partial [Prorocentrum cordatum]
MVELYALIDDGIRAMSLRVTSAVGPALAKAVLRGELLANAKERGEARKSGAGRVRRYAVPLVRHVFYRLIKACMSESTAGALLLRLMQARAAKFPERPRVFDLQGVQCKVCTWIMALGGGHWFRQWRGTATVVCATISPLLMCEDAAVRRITLDTLKAWAPVITLGGYTGVAAVNVAQLMGENWPRQAVEAAKITCPDDAVVAGSGQQKRRILLNAVGVADLLLNMGNRGELKKVKGYCAQVLGGTREAPLRRSGSAGILPFVLDLVRAASVNLTVPK